MVAFLLLHQVFPAAGGLTHLAVDFLHPVLPAVLQQAGHSPEPNRTEPSAVPSSPLIRSAFPLTTAGEAMGSGPGADRSVEPGAGRIRGLTAPLLTSGQWQLSPLPHNAANRRRVRAPSPASTTSVKWRSFLFPARPRGQAGGVESL